MANTNWGEFTPIDQPAASAADSRKVNWSEFEPVKTPERSTLQKVGDRTLDTAIDAAKGVVGLGESAVGVADLVTGNAVGNVLKSGGYDPKATKEFFERGYSDDRVEANRKVAEAKGFVDTAKAMLENPSTLAGAVTESAPQMIGAAGAVRLAATRMLAAEGLTAGTAAAAEFLKRPDVLAKLATIGSAAEGGLTAGQIQEQARQEGREYSESAPYALAAGAGTAVIGKAASKIMPDVDVTAATLGLGKTGERAGLIETGKKIATGMFQEGFLEEMPQSAQEQVFTNLATNRPWDEGVGAASAQGLLAGAAMGGGINSLNSLASRQRKAEENLSAAATTGDAISAANELAGSVQEFTAAVDQYLATTGPSIPTPQQTVAETQQSVPAGSPELRSMADRNAELIGQANQAGTQFDRENLLAQSQVPLGEPRARTADQYVDLTPMNPREAQARLAVLRDMTAREGGNSLELVIQPHPSQQGKLAIGKQALPSLDLGTSAAPVSQQEAQNRIESAALGGKVNQAKAEDQNSRQVVIDRALRNVEERGGVASPAEAKIFQEAGLGKPYDRIDTNLAPALSTDQKLTQATGIALEATPRESGSESQRVANLQQTNNASMAEQEARAQANRQQADRELNTQIAKANEPAPVPVNAAIEALATTGTERSAEQNLAIRQAEQRLSPTDFSIIQRAATAPFQLNTEERSRLKALRAGPTQTQSVVNTQQTRENTDLMGERVRAALGLPSNGAIVTTGAKLSSNREGSTGTVTVNDNGETHTAEVVDVASLGNTFRMMQQVARIFGKRLVAFRSATLKADGFVQDNDNKSIYINAESQINPLAVFGHELLHLLKRDNPVAYRALATVVARNLDQKGRADFRGYYGKGADLEELTADLMGNRFQDPAFWSEVFAEIGLQSPEQAKGIIARLSAAINKAVASFMKVIQQGGFQSDRFVKDVDAIKAAVKQAVVEYAQQQKIPAMQMEAEQAKATSQINMNAGSSQQTQQTQQPEDITASAARRGGTVEEAGEFTIRSHKDGTLAVVGDPEAIRAALPEDVKGRAVPGGMVFTNAAAPRVRAALEGRQVAYSRAGQVVDKLPMKNGKYLGAPAKFDTPAKIPTLRKWLRQLADEGAPGRYWYENSSREVLQMVGGNVTEARKFVALLAIYSPQAKVDANSTFALRAWAQYKAGQPISVKTAVMDNKAQSAMDNVDAFWSGEKTGNFFFNLLREIDPSTAGKQGATIDMWMMRAGQYDSDAPTGTQYSFMENETNRLAQELGWEPQQVQAAIWVAMKARMENAGVKKATEASSEKKGWIRYDYPIKNGRPIKTRVILDAKAHRDNWLKHSFAHDPTKDDTQQAKFDFSDGVRRHIGQLSWEARPGRSTNVLPGVNDADYDRQVEFQQAVQKALLDDNGVDLLAYKLGLLVDGPDILAPGIWQGEVAAGMQKLIGMAPAKGDAGKSSIDEAQKKAIEAYAAMLGLLLRQEGVGYHRPFFKNSQSANNGVNLDIGRSFTPDEAKALWGALDERMRGANATEWENGAGMISTPTGMRVVNFGAIADNKQFRELVESAAETLPMDEINTDYFSSDGDLVWNDWKENPNGENYQTRIREAAGPDLLDWAGDVLAPRVQSVFTEFSSKYGWGDPGKTPLLDRESRQQEVSKEAPASKLSRTRGEQAETDYAKLREKYIGTPQWLKAPNGEPTKLTERQWLQVRTPQFKEWFGDWEKYAGMQGGVWNDSNGEVSKVVDENGEPLVVYHGTDKGGFSAFRQPGGQKRGDLGIWATSSLPMAMTYQKRGRSAEIRYTDMDRAPIEGGDTSGYYVSFMNLRNPYETDFEGAYWNGERRDQWVVTKAGEIEYTSAGKGYFDTEEEAQEFADKINGYVEEAPEHYESTDSAVREGRSSGSDGTIVRNVIDDGGGYSSYAGEPTDVFVAFNPEQLKSATQNTGEFGTDTDDMRFSRQRPQFFSQLARSISEVPARLDNQPAQQWKAWIASNAAKLGIKKEEIEWSGINDYLDLRGKDKVSKDDIGAYLKDSGVRVNDVTYGELTDRQRFEEAQRIALDEYGVEYGELGGDDQADIDDSIDENNSQYGEYTLPGGKNYREVVITLPSMGQKATERMMYLEAKRRRLSQPGQWVFDDDAEGKELKALQAKAKADTFQSNHFEAKNIVAHMRVNDRKDADGNKVLFVEEVQSDWGQKGKKQGFGKVTRYEYEAVQDNGQLVRSFRDKDEAEAFANERGLELKEIPFTVDTGIPAAPFVTKTEGWLNLALKRIAMLAVEGGYDKVAFVTGMQSADRYDLSKQIDSIGYDPQTRRLEAYDKNRKSVMNRTGVAEENLEDYVGKEVAKRLLEQPLVMGKHLLEGENIKVGGEGMITFYDKIVPQAMSKLLPKLGGDKLSTVGIRYQLDDGDYAQYINTKQPGFDVTDKMRETVSAGVPLFSPRRNIFGAQAPLANWTRPDMSQIDDVVYTMQDKMVDTKRVVDAIKGAIGSIDDKWNPYLQEELYHGRTAKETKDFLGDELRPLLQEMTQRGVTMEQFEEYLHNRFAEERNNQIAKVNPAFPDGGSGIDTADARAYLNGLTQQQRYDFDALAKRVDAITKGTRDLLVSSGLETADTISAWEKAYPHYVPLFREDVDFGSGGNGMGTGQGYSVRGSASKRATGSSRDVVDILANLAMQRERAIVRAEKARVATAVYGLAVQNPNTDFWLAVDPEGQKDPQVAINDLIKLGISPLDAQNIIQEPTQTYIDPRTGMVTQRINPALRSNPNVLAVRIDGRERYVFFNANDDRAQRMVEALKNLDADQLGRVMGMMATLTRYIASVNTQYNPIFGAVNFLRDTQGAAFNLSTTPIAGETKAVMAQVMPALKGIYADVRAERRGTNRPAGVWAQLWEEFQKEGGQTGYRDQFSRSAERAEALEREIKRINEGKAMQFGRAVFDWLADYNESMENAVRLSAYKVAKDRGMTNSQAASIAKNLTVNFNRKGQVATQAGALYAFFNASVQGTKRLHETLTGPAGKKIVAGGLILGAAQAVLLAAAGFDEDEPPDFVRERNVIIPIGGGKYVTIPMPLGFHVIPNTSRVLTEFALSGWRDPAKRVGQIAGAFLEAFNPIGNAGWSVQTIAPTVADPLVALAENRDYTGKQIAKKDMNSMDPTPGYTRAKDTASWFSKQLSYYLNLASGGTKYKPGLISPTPDQIDYLIGQATGGVGREIMKAEQAVSSVSSGEELPPNKIPLVGRFYGDTKSTSAESNRFYENVRRLNEHENEIKGRRKNHENPTEYIRENPEARLVNMANTVEREVSQLRKRKRELIEKGASRESVKVVETQITNRMKRLNDRVKQLQEQPTQ